jgi:hypothetical protein
MKTIRYIPKNTSAHTDYVIIDESDMLLVKLNLIHYLSIMGELHNIGDSIIRQIYYKYWTSKHKKLVKCKYGLNTPESFTSGLIRNLYFGTQTNLSMPTLASITLLSDEMFQLTTALNSSDTYVVPIIENITFIEDIIQFT